LNVGLVIQRGLQGPSVQLGAIGLDVPSVGQTSSWAGSYHILQMGRHYDDYVLTGYTAQFPDIVGLPPAHPYERLTGKIRASGVSGNVGECVAALFARRYMRANIADVIHIRSRQPFVRRKAPDYMMRLNSLMPGPFAPIVPPGINWAQPELWPVESKARSTGAGAATARRDALAQLAAYWSLLASLRPIEVGYGIVVSFIYQPPREVRVQLFLPKDQSGLRSKLATGNASEIKDARLGAFLHDC